MRLGEILRDCDYMEAGCPGESSIGNLTDDISGVAYDSRKVKEGHMFVAIKGERSDGYNFIGDAVSKGASAVVFENNNAGVKPETLNTKSEIAYIRVKDSRKALACIANNFYGRPSGELTLIGITGTNGKTTTTYILKSILDTWGKETGLIGTIQYMIKDKICQAVHTTPESPEFQGLLKDMLSSGCTHVISEVSSHALAQYRVDGSVFRTAVFTNLTRDHLDYHKTMEDYFRAKERLFRELLSTDGTAIINLDDSYGWNLNMELRMAKTEPVRIITYGLETPADIKAHDIETSFRGLKFAIKFRGKRYEIISRLTGMPNVYNILAAFGAAVSLDVPEHTISEGIARTEHVTGRFERVDSGQDFLCIIDYAHTEDALERLILTARQISNQQSAISDQRSLPRIITVFGCGGDRDRGKRPVMGGIATRLSDVVIITSDNPRSEEPAAIIRDIEDGAVNKNYIVIPDRREAIKKAVDVAGSGDIVLIAGKGHEDYQEIKGVRYPFSDRQAAEEAIKNRMRIS